MSKVCETCKYQTVLHAISFGECKYCKRDVTVGHSTNLFICDECATKLNKCVSCDLTAYDYPLVEEWFKTADASNTQIIYQHDVTKYMGEILGFSVSIDIYPDTSAVGVVYKDGDPLLSKSTSMKGILPYIKSFILMKLKNKL